MVFFILKFRVICLKFRGFLAFYFIFIVLLFSAARLNTYFGTCFSRWLIFYNFNKGTFLNSFCLAKSYIKQPSFLINISTVASSSDLVFLTSQIICIKQPSSASSRFFFRLQLVYVLGQLIFFGSEVSRTGHLSQQNPTFRKPHHPLNSPFGTRCLNILVPSRQQHNSNRKIL